MVTGRTVSSYDWLTSTGSSRGKGHLVRIRDDVREKITLCGRPIAKSWRSVPGAMVFDPCIECVQSQRRIMEHESGQAPEKKAEVALRLGFAGQSPKGNSPPDAAG